MKTNTSPAERVADGWRAIVAYLEHLSRNDDVPGSEDPISTSTEGTE